MIVVTVGVLLMEEDSRKVDAENLEDIASLANAVQGGFQRFRTFTANDLGRFVLQRPQLRHCISQFEFLKAAVVMD